jgi:glycosyltransferase involved in cell wall biosynthesis
MLLGNKIVVVMPAYNAELTLRRTYEEIMAQGIVDEVIVVDDSSRDATAAIARTLPQTRVAVHPKNRGYGETRRRAIAWRGTRGRTSSSWFIPITSTRRG